MQKNRTICCVGVIFWLLCSSLFAQNGLQIPEELETALLNENWQQVANLLDTVDTQTPSPVLRLIKGHACLALNRNNESLCLFLSLRLVEELESWEEWTFKYSTISPNQFASNYFYGDALARLNKLTLAISYFIKSSSLPNITAISKVMAYNACGVTNSIKEDWNLAVVYLKDAIKISQSFADAHASLGGMYLQKRSGFEGAKIAFDHALIQNPNFALVYNGRAAVAILTDSLTRAKTDLQYAKKHAPDCAIDLQLAIIDNAEAISELEIQAIRFALGDTTEYAYGMSLEKRVEWIRSKIFSDDEISKYMGVLLNNKCYNADYAQFAADKIEITNKYELGAGKNAIGNSLMAKLSGAMTGTINERKITLDNLKYQDQSIDALKIVAPNVKPKNVGNIEAFLNRGKINELQKSTYGGVTTHKLADGKMNQNQLKINSLFGLAYPITK